jgi:hypothetical protein
MSVMQADQTMADVMAVVALSEARRTGLIQFVDHTGASWHLHAQGTPPIAGADSLAVVLPGEDRMGVAKRILGARMSGLHVPQDVLALVGAAKALAPKPARSTKAALAASVSPQVAAAVEAVKSYDPTPHRPSPTPHELKPPATVQGELW